MAMSEQDVAWLEALKARLETVKKLNREAHIREDFPTSIWTEDEIRELKTRIAAMET